MAEFPQAHPINDKSLQLMEGMAMNLENAPISAGGAGRFPDPNAINGMSPFVPTKAFQLKSRISTQIASVH
jgi:hypothetical protein